MNHDDKKWKGTEIYTLKHTALPKLGPWELVNDSLI